MHFVPDKFMLKLIHKMQRYRAQTDSFTSLGHDPDLKFKRICKETNGIRESSPNYLHLSTHHRPESTIYTPTAFFRARTQNNLLHLFAQHPEEPSRDKKMKSATKKKKKI